MNATRLPLFTAALLLAATASAQQVPMPDSAHAPMKHPMACADSAGHPMGACPMRMMPLPSGAPAFDAIAAQVEMLDADSTTDWSKVDLEGFRQHLIDMNDVMMNSTVVPMWVRGGITVTISGSGRTVAAIQRMVVDHMAMLQKSGAYVTTVTTTKSGVTATVIALAPASAKAVGRIRGLGFAGLMTEGTHHMRHHRAMARGDSMPHAH